MFICCRDLRTEMKREGRGGVARRKMAARIVLCIIIALTLTAGRVLQWVMSQVSLDLDEIIFTLSHPVEGTDPGFYLSVIKYSLIPAAAVLVVVITVQHVLDKLQERGPAAAAEEVGGRRGAPGGCAPAGFFMCAAPQTKKKVL